MSLNLKSLIGKLNDTTQRTLNDSLNLAMRNTHYDAEVEHFLLAALESSDNDIASILKHYEINKSRVQKELQISLDSFSAAMASHPRSATR